MFPEENSHTSKVFHCRMVRTRGGLITSTMPPPRLFTTDIGVKVRKVNGGFRYQPPTLISYLALNINKEDRVPISKLLKEIVEALILKIQTQNVNSGIELVVDHSYDHCWCWWCISLLLVLINKQFLVAQTPGNAGGIDVELNGLNSSSKDKVLSEFTSTPNTSVHSTPTQTPDKSSQEEQIIMFPDNPAPATQPQYLRLKQTGLPKERT